MTHHAAAAPDRRPVHIAVRVIRGAAAALILTAAAGAAAQDRDAQDTGGQAASPGINDTYLSPDLDVDRFVENFEGESREVFAARHAVVDALGIEAGDRIADIGSGTGFYSLLFAAKAGADGTVYAIDLAPDFLRLVNDRAAAAGHDTVVAVLGRRRVLTLPEGSIDIAFTSDVYHHFEFPDAMVRSIHDALTPGGTFIVIDFERIPGETSDFTIRHVRAGKETVIEEVERAGFTLVEEVKLPQLRENYFLRFRK